MAAGTIMIKRPIAVSFSVFYVSIEVSAFYPNTWFVFRRLSQKQVEQE